MPDLQHFRDTALDSGVWRVSNFYHGIFRFAVAVFVMISGTLYLDSKRNWSLKKLWRKNILQIAAAYAFWQFFYAVYRIVVSGNMEGPVLFLKKVLIYCSSSYFHLWYLPMLAGLLAVTPLLWEIVNCERGKKWEEYLILLFLIFKILPYTMNWFLISAERVCYGSDVYDSAWNDSGLCRIFCSGALSFSL